MEAKLPGNFFFLIGIHFMQGWRATTRYGVTRKRNSNRLGIQKICLAKNLGQRKAFYRQRIHSFETCLNIPKIDNFKTKNV